MSDWISVEDRLPAETHSIFWRKTLNPIVTHWMPLPAPPDDDELEEERDAEKRTHD